MKSGTKIGEWNVIGRAEDRRDQGQRGADARYWLCRCSCPAQTEREISEHTLVRGTSTSCGCSRAGKPSQRFKDLTGHTYERWTVKHKTRTDAHDNTYWCCVCSCANQTEREVSGKSLTSGRSRSCGCLKDELASERLKGKPSGRLEDLTGRQFGKWTVTELAYRRYSKKNSDLGPRIFWNCKCACGNEKIVDAATLKGGHSKSCGCSPYFNDLTGKVFGRLTVVIQDGRSERGHVRWLCSCTCGGQKTVDSNDLVTGNIASRGCAKQEGIIVRSDDVRQKKQEANKRQYREDIKFNLNRRMSAMIRLALRREGTEKGGRHWPDMVGYTVQELQERLEATMPEGFTWDDYLTGKLHIDHIIPLAAHNYEYHTDIDFGRAWALSNLRLLPGPENMNKNDRLDEPFQPSLLISAT